jgi:hypothetical protein
MKRTLGLPETRRRLQRSEPPDRTEGVERLRSVPLAALQAIPFGGAFAQLLGDTIPSRKQRRYSSWKITVCHSVVMRSRAGGSLTMVEGETTARRSEQSGHARGSLGFALALMVVAFLVVMVAGEHVGLGPLDLRTADDVALAIWAVAPVLGGLLGRHGGPRELTGAAVRLGALVGACVALFFSFGAGTGGYVCSIDIGSMPRPIGTLLVGGLTGAGIALGYLISGLASRRRMTLLPGLALAIGAVLVTSLAAKDLFYEAVRCL